MNGATLAEARRNMIAPIESDDPDFLVHSAWLAEVSKGGDDLLANDPKQVDGSPNVSTSSLYPADQLVGQGAPLALRRERRSGLIMVIVPGCIMAMALAAGIAIRPHFAFRELATPDGRRHAWPDSSEPLTSAATRREAQTPQLIVEPSLGVAGEPVPIRLALRGWGDNDAIIIIKGLGPGMELSTGSAVAVDTWQLSARDLPYVWIAPPQGFIGSADLVAELRLPNAQIADRQTLHVKWTRSAQEREQIAPPRQENEVQPPVGPPTIQHRNNRGAITAAPPISAEPLQGQIDRERGKNNLRRSVNEINRRAPLATLYVGESSPAVKGFWDWSR
jgi:hypothetical protein